MKLFILIAPEVSTDKVSWVQLSWWGQELEIISIITDIAGRVSDQAVTQRPAAQGFSQLDYWQTILQFQIKLYSFDSFQIKHKIFHPKVTDSMTNCGICESCTSQLEVCNIQISISEALFYNFFLDFRFYTRGGRMEMGLYKRFEYVELCVKLWKLRFE